MTVGTSNFPFGKVTFRMGYLKLPGCIQSENESDVLYKIQLVACYPNSTNKKQKNTKTKQAKHKSCKKTNKKKQPLQPTCVQNIIQPPSLPNEPWHPHRWRKHVVDAKPWRRNPGNTFSNEGEEQPAAGWWEQDEVELLLLFIFWRCVESTVNNMYTIYIDI